MAPTEPKFEGNIPWQDLTLKERNQIVQYMQIEIPGFHAGMLPFLSRQTFYRPLQDTIVDVGPVSSWLPIWQSIYAKVFIESNPWETL
jgi:hypothetical protein